MKPLTQAAPVQSAVSWWTLAKRENFTKQAEQEHPRMSKDPSGKGRSRPISTDEFNR